MPELLPNALTIAALLTAAWTLIPLVRDRGPDRILLGALALIEIGLIVLAVLGIVALTGTDREIDTLSFVAYLIGTLFILPVATAWALAERSRWGNAVLLIGCLAIPVMILRMNQIWAGEGV
ncbi:hypothetical protein [Haloechinothrix sp. LS1_15]|uniref:hypothetical protein n=1 Tax=Haloechinothrix sp. LS1_15 TaxID=2652248 RepID=UPI0029489670|nr:hypothetical protein [Haloechinothrix sp. LS1_15]MDV6012706.1 hypothetical protein [Haloechinothrix sp. LS1_15]